MEGTMTKVSACISASMNTAVVIPHRGVNAHRDSNLACATRRWNDFGLEVFAADSDGPLFSRAQAINRAAAKTDADVLIVADNDIMLDKPEQAVEAAELALKQNMYVVAFSELRVLDWDETLAVREGADPFEQPVLETIKLIWSNCFAITHVLFNRVGGFDERFVGCGHQDGAFLNCCSTLAGKDRVFGVAFHLRHEPPDRSHSHMHDNAELAVRYRQADGDKKAMLALMAER